MKQIRLLQLELAHFKCHSRLVLDFRGDSCNLAGGNGAGKTSVYEALAWLLFDRNPGIRPIGAEDGTVTAVEGTFSVDGEARCFRRTLQGKVYEYFVDGAPCRKTGYLEQVQALAPDLWLLMDVYRFSRDMSWQQRRELLFQAAGLPTDEMLLKLPQFSQVRQAVGHLSLDTYREKLQSQCRERKAQRLEKTARAAEVREQIHTLENRDYAALRLQWEEARRADPLALEAERKTRQRLREELRRAEAESRFSGVCPLCGQALQGEALEKAEARRREAQERRELLHRELDSDFESRWNARSTPERLEQLACQLAGQDMLPALRQRAEALEQEARQALQEQQTLEEQLEALEEVFRLKARWLENWLKEQSVPGQLRLFRSRPDGSSQPRCDVEQNGIPYEQLSTGEQVRLGLGFIRLFSKLWDVSAPVFVDNAEALSTPIEGPWQVIRLVAEQGPLRLER